MRKVRRGMALLEALVALAILSTVASTVAWKTGELLQAVSRAHAREADVRAAQRLMTAASLWPRATLDLHLGSRQQGIWTMTVQRTSETLYEVVLVETASGASVLSTALFRDAE